MGLIIQSAVIDGVTVTNGYVRIDRYGGSKREGAQCHVGVYPSYEAAQVFGAYPYPQFHLAFPWPTEEARIEKALYPAIKDWLNSTYGPLVIQDTAGEGAPTDDEFAELDEAQQFALLSQPTGEASPPSRAQKILRFFVGEPYTG